MDGNMSNSVMETGSMVDISSLGNLQPSEPLDLETYAETSSFRLPVAGIYSLRAPDSFPAEAFAASKAGYLTALISPTITGPTNEGFTIRFIRVSAKPYDSKGTLVSQAGLYLRACGVKQIPGDVQELANAIAATAGQTWQAELDWEARHYQTNFSVKGMRNFPSDGNGGYQSWVQHPTEMSEDGTPLRVKANLVIRRFISA